MSFDKAIKYGKERRKPFKKAKAVDGSCRNHGGCEYCRDNRIFFDTKKRMFADKELKEWLKMGDNYTVVPFKVNDILMCKNGTGPFIVLDVLTDNEPPEMVIMDLAAYKAGEESNYHNTGFEWAFEDFELRKEI